MEEKNSLEFLINALMPQTQIKKDEAETKEADKNIYTRQINALSAAIPFLDGEYQKNIFLLVKLLEFRRFAGERTALSAQEYGVVPISELHRFFIKKKGVLMTKEEVLICFLNFLCLKI